MRRIHLFTFHVTVTDNGSLLGELQQKVMAILLKIYFQTFNTAWKLGYVSINLSIQVNQCAISLKLKQIFFFLLKISL